MSDRNHSLSVENPMGLDGFEFVEFAAPEANTPVSRLVYSHG